jgi:hypothetical protein
LRFGIWDNVEGMGPVSWLFFKILHQERREKCHKTSNPKALKRVGNKTDKNHEQLLVSQQMPVSHKVIMNAACATASHVLLQPLTCPKYRCRSDNLSKVTALAKRKSGNRN